MDHPGHPLATPLLDAMHISFLLGLLEVGAPVNQRAIRVQHWGAGLVPLRAPPRLAGFFSAHTVSSAIAAAGDTGRALPWDDLPGASAAGHRNRTALASQARGGSSLRRDFDGLQFSRHERADGAGCAHLDSAPLTVDKLGGARHDLPAC